jgi:hypothetical protein
MSSTNNHVASRTNPVAQSIPDGEAPRSVQRVRRRQLFSVAAVAGAVSLLGVATFASDFQPASAQATAPSSDIRGSYVYKPLKIGAGGFVTGLVINKTNDDLMFARTDVGGAYKWNAGTQSWRQMITVNAITNDTPPKLPTSYLRLTSEKRDNDYGVESIAITPADPKLVLLAVGNSIGDKLGRILRSTDGGETFVASTQRWSISGNEQTGGRVGAERLALDPANANVGFFATRRDGLLTTADGGATWQPVSSSEISSAIAPTSDTIGIRFAEYDPTSGVVGGKTKRAYFGVAGKGIYEYDSSTNTFTNIDSDRGFIYDVAIGSDGLLWVSVGTNIRVWDPATRTWSVRSPVVDRGFEQLITIDPKDPKRVFIAKGGISNGRFWRSLNGGQSWDALNIALAATTVPWLAKSGEENSMTAGRLVMNAKGELWFAQGAGMWRTTDLGDAEVTWNESSVGIEELVGTDIAAPLGGDPVTAVLDFHGFSHDNVDAYRSKMMIGTAIGANTGLDYSGGNPKFMVAAGAITNRADISCGYDNPCWGVSGYSTDGGQNWTPFTNRIQANANDPLRDGTYVLGGGTAMVSADAPNPNGAPTILWVPTNNRAPHTSKDFGQTWQQVPYFNGANTNYRTGFHRRVGDSDKVAGNTFYVNIRTPEGWRVATSRDGGATWKNGDVVGVSPYDDFDVLGQLRAVPGKSGHLFVSGALNGFFRSTDYGATAQKIASIRQVFSFGFGAPAPGASYPTIYAHGDVGGVWGVWRSVDEGATWQLIADYPLGLYDGITTVMGDMNRFGRVYMSIGGNGFVYGDDGGTPPPPPITTTSAPSTTTAAPTTTLAPTTTIAPTTTVVATSTTSTSIAATTTTAPATTATPTTTATTTIAATSTTAATTTSTTSPVATSTTLVTTTTLPTTTTRPATTTSSSVATTTTRPASTTSTAVVTTTTRPPTTTSTAAPTTTAASTTTTTRAAPTTSRPLATTTVPTTAAPTTAPPTTIPKGGCTENVLRNPGFENGLADWGTWANRERLVRDAKSGRFALRVGGRQQTFRVTAGEKLDVSVWAKVARAQGWSGVGIDFFDTEENVGGSKTVQITAKTFSKTAFTVTVPATATIGRVWAWSGSRVLTVDDWCVDPQ